MPSTHQVTLLKFLAASRDKWPQDLVQQNDPRVVSQSITTAYVLSNHWWTSVQNNTSGYLSVAVRLCGPISGSFACPDNLLPDELLVQTSDPCHGTLTVDCD